MDPDNRHDPFKPNFLAYCERGIIVIVAIVAIALLWPLALLGWIASRYCDD